MTDETKIQRYFLRCRGCLSIMAIEGERPPTVSRCSACQGGVEVMGQVQYQRITRPEDHTPCDLRCTMASGPSCDYQCGGKNHGSGIIVTAAIDRGGIPRVTPPNPERARRIHSEWLAESSATRMRIARHFPQGLQGKEYLDQVLAASNLKTHHGRLTALRKINQKLTDGAR